MYIAYLLTSVERWMIWLQGECIHAGSTSSRTWREAPPHLNRARAQLHDAHATCLTAQAGRHRGGCYCCRDSQVDLCLAPGVCVCVCVCVGVCVQEEAAIVAKTLRSTSVLLQVCVCLCGCACEGVVVCLWMHVCVCVCMCVWFAPGVCVCMWVWECARGGFDDLRDSEVYVTHMNGLPLPRSRSMSVSVSVSVFVFVCASVSVCERKRERKRESVCVCRCWWGECDFWWDCEVRGRRLWTRLSPLKWSWKGVRHEQSWQCVLDMRSLGSGC